MNQLCLFLVPMTTTLPRIAGPTPSEFVTQTALAKIIKNNLYGFGKDRITQLIREKQKQHKNRDLHKKVA